MAELKYAQKSGATHIFFYVQTFIGNRTKADESFDSSNPLDWTNRKMLHRIVPPTCCHRTDILFNIWFQDKYFHVKYFRQKVHIYNFMCYNIVDAGHNYQDSQGII